MRKKIFQIFGYILLVSFLILSGLIFIPRSYHVPQLADRTGTKYWNLSTGSRIAYTLVPAKGAKKTYPIIFLQGGPGGFISDRNIATLSLLADDGYDVYLYDQIGSGHSARLENIEEYTAERHKRDLEEIVKQIHTDKVILIGQSWGAILATLFIADNPEKVDKLILTGPGPIQPQRRELASIPAPDSLHLIAPLYWNAQANAEASNLRMKCVTKCALLFGVKLTSDKEADDFQTYLNDKLNKSTVCDTSKALRAEGGGGFYAQWMTVNSFSEVKDPRSQLKSSSIPVLVMKGQCDSQFWGFTNEYLQLFRNARLVIIPNAGHSISIEQPDLYLKTMRDFLKE